MMRKIMMIVLLLLALALGEKAQAQQLIAVAGAGVFKNSPMAGDYEFAEARLMFGFHGFRYGPMASFTRVYLNQNTENSFFKYRSQFYAIGLSVDKWWQTTATNYYFWVNSGIGWGYDQGTGPSYELWQKDQLFLAKGGFRLTKPFNSWLGNSLLMAEFQTPISGEARYSTAPGIIESGTPYKKGEIRLTFENGIKKIPLFYGSFIEPTAHIGLATDDASKRLFVEYGGGISIGYFREIWDRELFKVIAFKRQDLKGHVTKLNDGSKSSLLQIELVVNLLNFYPEKN